MVRINAGGIRALIIATAVLILATGIVGVTHAAFVPPTIPISDGFDYPIGDFDGDGSYISPDGITYNGWIVKYDVTDPNYIEHTGEDWNGVGGGDTDLYQPVYAVSNGRVIYSDDGGSGWGNIILIKHKSQNGTIVFSQYAHIDTILINNEETVRRRQQIGTLGRTGLSADQGAHLHFEMRKANMSAYSATYWPNSHGKDTQWIRDHYYDPSDHNIDRYMAPGFIDDHRPIITPLIGNWNGNNIDTTGTFDPRTSSFSLDNGATALMGEPGDLPIIGNWDGSDGKDTIGVYRPKTAQFFLDDNNDGIRDYDPIYFGDIGDFPIVGDWNGDGCDNIGVFRSLDFATLKTTFFLNKSDGSVERIEFGQETDIPIVGDWNNDGRDDIGVFRRNDPEHEHNAVFYLKIGTETINIAYGNNDDVPIVGKWDNDGLTKIGVFRPSTQQFIFNHTPLVDSGNPQIWYVDDDLQDYPNADFTRIQDAVDAASDGDTILVYPGTYTENVDVNKEHLTIKSENGAETTIVQAADQYDNVFEIAANYVNLSGFTVKSTSNIPVVYLTNVRNCKIEKNIINNGFGIKFEDGCDNLITKNIIKNTAYPGLQLPGISIIHSNNNIIISNAISYHSVGIMLSYSNNNLLDSNNILNNSVGIAPSAPSSDNNTITNNIISNGGHGIQLNGNYNLITNNTISDNDYSVYSLSHVLKGNKLYVNNFISNSGILTKSNIWNSTSKITYTYNGNTYTNYMGNYWDDYTDVDINNDGIWDTPYNIDSDNDNYPLVEPWENYAIAPPAPNQPPTCAIELQKAGISIANINVGEFFDVYVGDSTDDQGIKEVRFSSDETQDGNPTGEWTDWYDWATSSGDWDAANKIKAWSFATAGDKEVWAEVKDGDGQTDKGSANIYANQLPIAKPVITSPLEITAKDIYYVGDTISSEFTITNRGEEIVTFAVLVVGGRDPTGEVVDFDKKYNIALDSGDSYDYQGYLTLPDKIGIYHFFCAYQTPDGNWNTNIDVEIDGEIVEDFSEAKIYRERDIIVFEETYISPAPPQALWEKIDGPWDSWPKTLGNWNEAPQIAVNPNNPNEIYVDAIHRTNNWWEDQGGTLYKSTDGGDSWDPINHGLPLLTWSEYYWPIRAIAIAPSNPDIVYVGTTDFNPYSSPASSAKGIYKSTNGGSDWTSVDGPYNGWIFKTYHSISSIVVNPIDPNTVYVGTVCGGIWRTTNGGESWENIWEEGPFNNEAFLDVNALAVSPTNPNIIYAAAYNFNPLNLNGASGLFIPNRLIKSIDGGNTWERLSLRILTAVPKIDDIAIDNKNADIVYAITDSFNAYKSTDGGQNWADASGTAGADPLPFPSWLGPTWGSSNKIAIHHDQSHVIYATRLWEFCGVYFSPNSGENWFHIGLQDVSVKKLEFASNANYRFLYAAGIEGLFKLDLSGGLIEVALHSPGELRVYDSQGRVTGLVNGEIKEEIPNSMYNEENKIVTLIFPTDSYHYEVVGTGEGTYGLSITSVENGEAITFTATDIPTTVGATQEYSVDWNVLSQGEAGVTVQVDSDGDGTFEYTFTADNELTQEEFLSGTDGEPIPEFTTIAIPVAIVLGLVLLISRRKRER